MTKKASTIEVFDHEQGSDAWKRARIGIPTASEFSTILAKGKDGGPSKTRLSYMRKLAGEIITGEPAEDYTNAYMARGNAMEAEARDYYALMHDVELTRVGFVKNGPKGCSPDSLIGTDGALEIKTQAPHLLIERLFNGDIPPEHIAQLQGTLWVCEREWIDIGVFYRGMPMYERRMVRNETYIKELTVAVKRFNEELDELVAKIRGMT
jgi:hypothetical protein